MAKDFSASGANAAIQTDTGVTQFVGAAPVRAVAPTERLRMPRNAPFLLVYYPTRWGCHPDTGQWFPILSRLRSDVGLNGYDKNGDDTLCRARIARKGGVIIPESAAPRGYTSYIQAIPAEGGDYHCLIWERPQMLAGQVMESLIDEEGYFGWLASLIENGVIRPPPQVVINMITGRERKKLDMLERDSHLRGVPEKIEAEKAQIAQMEQGRILGVDDAPEGPSVAGQQAAELADLKAELAEMKALLAAQKGAPASSEPPPRKGRAPKAEEPQP